MEEILVVEMGNIFALKKGQAPPCRGCDFTRSEAAVIRLENCHEKRVVLDSSRVQKPQCHVKGLGG